MSSRASKRRKVERERLNRCDQVVTLDVTPLGTFVVDTKYFDPPSEKAMNEILTSLERWKLSRGVRVDLVGGREGTSTMTRMAQRFGSTK